VIAAYGVVGLLSIAGGLVNDLHHDAKAGDGAKKFADAVLFASYDNPSESRLANRAGHWFGTDDLGRDVLARIANGSGIAVVARAPGPACSP